MGGPSREHDVSLKTGAAVLKSLDQDKYKTHSVIISLANSWSIDNDKELSSVEAVDELKRLEIEVVFLALHGSFGEDGTVQGLLDMRSLKYTGSDVRASLLAMNKTVSGDLLRVSGLKVPATCAFDRYELVKGVDIDRIGLGLPLIVKPASQGSSIGVTLVAAKEDVLPAVEFALEHDNTVIIQQYIEGREVSCGVLEIIGSNELEVLPPTELKPVNADFFDFYAKYTAGATEEITPADMSDDLIKRIQNITAASHKVLGCRGYSRTDMIVKGKDIFVIETNTLPGLTDTSILPQQAKVAGISFPQLLERIITAALSTSV
jgi:D-alanine-D-alanine ligase